MIANFWANALYSVTPTILVGLVFWLVMRSIFRADRSERSVYSKIEAEERARIAAEAPKADRATGDETPATRNGSLTHEA